jgi:signal transduction histidine kinase
MVLSEQPEPIDELQQVSRFGASTEDLFQRIYLRLAAHDAAGGDEAPARYRLTRSRSKQRQHGRVLAALGVQDAQIRTLHQALAMIEEGVVILDRDDRVLLVNAAAERMLGSEQRLLTGPLGDLYRAHRDDAPLEGDATRPLVPLHDTQRMALNGSALDARTAAIFTDSGERLGTVFVLRDATVRSLDERLRTGVISQLTHELNTPLAVMRVANEMLLEKSDPGSPDRRMLEMLSNNIDVLSRMIDEMVDVAQISSGAFSLNLAPVDVEDLVTRAVAEMSGAIVQNGLDVMLMVRASSALTTLADADRLQWALTQVLRNSTQYTPAGGHLYVLVSADRTTSGADEITIVVHDTGVGISPRDLPHVFEMYYRGEARTVDGNRIDPRGLGQGLAVVQRVLEAHDGLAILDSEVGKGTTVTLRLPSKPA